jgi:short-subunit dehydrogenase
MGTVAITGAAGGIMAALRTILEKRGDEVIGIGRRNTDVVADLSTAAGRDDMIREVTARSGGKLDGVVAGAAMLRTTPDDPGT